MSRKKINYMKADAAPSVIEGSDPPLRTRPSESAIMPYPIWHYFVSAIWRLVQATFWKLCWKRVYFLRPALLKLFGTKIPYKCLIHGTVRIHSPWYMETGKDIAIGDGVNLYNLGGLKLGSRVIISQNSYLCGGTHDYTKGDYPLVRKPIKVGDDVWICAGAFIGPGVEIGDGAVIGACAVVTKDVEPWTVVAGNPAVVVKRRIISD